MSATDQTTKTQLIEVFHAAVEDHEDVMAECLSIIRLYSLSPQDLFYKYEAFVLSRPSGLRAKLSMLTLDVARELRKEIQRESQAKALAASTVGAGTPGDKAVGVRKKAVTDLGGFLDGLTTPSRPKHKTPAIPSRLSNAGNNANLPSTVSGSSTFSPNGSLASPLRTPTGPTASSYRPSVGSSHLAPPTITPIGKTVNAPSSPISGSESPSILTPLPTQPFHLRPQPHLLVETLNPHLSAGSGVPAGSRPRVALSTTSDPKTWDYRYMFEKISARSEALDEQIEEFAEVIREAYGLFDLGDPHLVSEEDIYTVGRILSPPTDTSKASTSSLFLESSRTLGGGKRIALRFSPPGTLKVRGGAAGVRGFGVFPGCLVCVRGRNGGGDAFVVDEVLIPPPSPLNISSPAELLDFQYGEKLNGLPLSLYTAAGPYTLDDDLLFEPLEALVDVVCDERPDVVVLLGPFIDAAHPLIQAGKVTMSPTELFRDQIASRIARIHEASPATLVLLVPSVRDLISRHVAYPQGMLEREGLGLSKKVKLLPNPCSFSINEINIALSSTDVLFHLRKEEVFQRAEEAEPDPSVPVSVNPAGDPMANLVRHVLKQRHFYPIFPAPESVSHEVNLDVTHWHLLRMESSAPDIIILPSKLKHFSKVVDSTLVVNPAHLSRPHGAGTFAKITIHPTPESRLRDDLEMDGGLVDHCVWERARSEILRI